MLIFVTRESSTIQEQPEPKQETTEKHKEILGIAASYFLIMLFLFNMFSVFS